MPDPHPASLQPLRDDLHRLCLSLPEKTFGMLAEGVGMSCTLMGQDAAGELSATVYTLDDVQEAIRMARQDLTEGHYADSRMHALAKHPGDSSVTHGPGVLDDALARASLELGDTAKTKELAQKQLAANTDTTSWNYGTIIHEANSTLGRAALRDGDRKLTGLHQQKPDQWRAEVRAGRVPDFMP